MSKRAYLFLCLHNRHYAVSDRSDGNNLPKDPCFSDWKYIRALKLDVNAPLPFAADPEPILRALRDEGYWIAGKTGQTHGTAQ
jgi:hypothetical protein